MPSMSFTRCGKYPYRKGKFYLGVSPLLRRPVGIELRRHGLIFSGSGGGKGACLLSQNLFRWPHNALVVDPKGEAAEITAAYRKKKFNHNVYVIDPFHECRNLPDNLRANYNPLADIDPTAQNIVEDIKVITDGMVMEHNQEHAMWDNNAKRILNGLIAFVKLAEPLEQQNLPRVREILLSDDSLRNAAEIMVKHDTCGGVMQSAAAVIASEQGSQFIDNARENTDWLRGNPMTTAHSGSSFSLSDLKRKKTTIYLVLPPNYLKIHSRFLRLFVRCAIDQMARRMPDGQEMGQECLFMLDEFAALGRIEEISTSYGLLRSRGLHIVAILQNLGQLTSLYGKDGTENFFSGADFQSYFALDDPKTCEHLSQVIGSRQKAGLFGADEEFIGKRYMTAQEVKKHVAPRGKYKIARRMINITNDDVLSIRPKVWFKERRFKKTQ